MEREWLLTGLRFGDGGFFVLDATLFLTLQDFLVAGLSCGLGNLVGAEVHSAILIFLLLLNFSLFIQPSLANGLSLGLSVLTSAHAERLWNSNIVLALASLRNHVLLRHQLLFQCSSQFPAGLLWVFVLISCSLSSGRVNILNGEA